jgi:hypothetical protein
MTLGALDLSIVTDHIIDELRAAKDATRLWEEISKFDIGFSGALPHHARKSDDAGCTISLYLFHVSPSAAHRSTFPLGGQARTSPRHPLGLTLYYLLSAHAADSYRQEQQAMSIALKCIHDQPVMTAAVPGTADVERFTLTLEPHSADEIGRLWLALATPIRLSAVYRAEVIFLAAEEPEARERGIVLEPGVDAITSDAVDTVFPAPAVSPPTSTDTAKVTGAGFDAATLSLRIGGLAFAVVDGVAPDPGQASVISESELHVRLPAGTRHGRYLLEISLFSGGPTQTVELHLEQDVP